MRHPGGYVIVTDPGAPTLEYDTFTCGHCQTIVPVPPYTTAPGSTGNGWCYGCDRTICGPCKQRALTRGCEIWEKQMEQIESRDRLARQVLGG